MTAVANETIAHLEFEHQVPCDGEKDCSNKVVWRAVHLCCGTVELYCDEHKMAYVAWLAWFERQRKKNVRHATCGTLFPNNTPSKDIVRFYPIEG